MNTIAKWTTSLLLLSGAAYAQVPSTNDTSDGFGNTGMGTGTLQSVAPGTCDPNGTSAGCFNTAAGFQALHLNMSGSFNTATGYGALQFNTSGSQNTATGYGALQSSTGNSSSAFGWYALLSGGGGYNSAFGDSALRGTTSGFGNSAFGAGALAYNTTGSINSAFGLSALKSNTIGISNAAFGESALNVNTAGNANTALGSYTLESNTTGGDNAAAGYQALQGNMTGSWNTAFGYRALYRNKTGTNNTASGVNALLRNTSGSSNIALGDNAGSQLTTGSNNIEIGNVGIASDNNMIKIGTEGTQAKTFIAGIYNTSVTGGAVMVNASGQLGVVVSSERFKTAIAPIGANMERLSQLRPVTFKLKSDASGTVQYGLIAEEVAKVYPELVIRDENGRIDGVRYDELAPMLLNEVQQQAAKIASLEQQLAEIHAALATMQPASPVVAQR